MRCDKQFTADEKSGLPPSPYYMVGGHKLPLGPFHHPQEWIPLFGRPNRSSCNTKSNRCRSDGPKAIHTMDGEGWGAPPHGAHLITEGLPCSFLPPKKSPQKRSAIGHPSNIPNIHPWGMPCFGQAARDASASVSHSGAVRLGRQTRHHGIAPRHAWHLYRLLGCSLHMACTTPPMMAQTGWSHGPQRGVLPITCAIQWMPSKDRSPPQWMRMAGFQQTSCPQITSLIDTLESSKNKPFQFQRRKTSIPSRRLSWAPQWAAVGCR